MNNEEEPAIYRANAATFLGIMKQGTNLQEAADYYRQGLDYANQSPPTHADRVLMFSPYIPDQGGITVGSRIEVSKLTLKTNLSVLEGKILAAAEHESLSEKDCSSKIRFLGGVKSRDIDLEK